MGPSGSGKSTLMHCLAGLDTLTSGQVFIGDIELGALSDKELTLLRRERLGFVFQAFNLRADAHRAREHHAARSTLAGRTPDPAWLDAVIDTVGLARPPRAPPVASCRAASSSASPSPAPWPAGPAIVFADEPTGNLDSRTGAEILGFLRRAVDDLGQTIVMVTHDPVAASYADSVVFLADGRIVDRLDAPHRRSACSTA